MKRPFETDIAEHIWRTRYRYRDDGAVEDDTIDDSWWRVAAACAGVETHPDQWRQRFHRLLQGFRFLPGGRILAGAGSVHDVTLFNCFVMGTIDDSMEGIFDALKEGGLTMQQGGGVGYDFSTLRPSGAPAWRVGSTASGPISFMQVWDAMCETLLSTGIRRGAMMATLRCDHPDIEAFIEAKRESGKLTNFNLSVLVTDAFRAAVETDAEWPLLFPLTDGSKPQASDEIIDRAWPGSVEDVACLVYKRVSARQLWQRIMDNAYSFAEPGVLFIDRINRLNNLSYCESIAATNPCGEIPLPPYGACNLGSINLTRFVLEPFSVDACWNLDELEQAAADAVRLLDNVIDISRCPLSQQQRQAKAGRRIGLGVTGLADALIMLGVHYGSEQGRATAVTAMAAIRDAAYRASIQLAEERGPFPLFERDPYLAGEFIRQLPRELQEGIARHGIRNSHLLAIAPTGTISLLANNISSGIEPVFEFEHRRLIRNQGSQERWYDLVDNALYHWQTRFPGKPLPDTFVDARSLSPTQHLAMQAALQPYVDNAISKTINVPADYSRREFSDIYGQAHALGLKGCTAFRPNPVTGAVLDTGCAEAVSSHCCSMDREES